MADLSVSGIRRLAKKSGAERISQDALLALRDVAEKFILKISSMATELANHANRKTVQKEDVVKATKMIFESLKLI
ncbi:MAG: histone family protein [Candidatus Njordarchaeia archaeon]|nr:NFYB/HAP3 family transcription factor subunit [Candidatus Korarchaeota archaeon]